MQRQFVGLIAAVTAIAVLAVGGAAAVEKPVTSVEKNIHAEFNGGFSPKLLSHKERTPISFWIQGRMKSRDGAHVAPLKEFLLEGDRNVSFSVKGIPVCRSGTRSQRTTPAAVRKECKESLIGEGRLEAEIAFYDVPPILVKSELLLFNGGFSDGARSLYLHAYTTVPTPASIISTIKVKRIDKGRFGLLATTTFPKIAGGSGSVTFFKLRLKKGILSAKCPDGHLDARGTAEFKTTPPTKLNAAVSRPCTGRD